MKRQFSASPGEISDRFREHNPEPGVIIPARIRLGTLIHRREQSRRHEFEAERFLKFNYITPNKNRLGISGRADLVRLRDDNVELIEIKSFALSPSEFSSLATPPLSHVIQTQIYGYLLHRVLKIPVENIRAKLLCVNIADDNNREFEIGFDPHDIEDIFDSYIAAERSGEARRLFDNRRRQKIAKYIRFPLDAIRPAQELIIDTVEKVFEESGDAVIEAPPGSGKTLAVLVPALQTALNHGSRLFYATAKSSGRNPVGKAIRQILPLSPNLTAAILSSQDEICRAGRSRIALCQTCNGIIPEIPDETTVDNKIALTGGVYETGQIVRIAEERAICPLLAAKSISCRVDLLVGDYNFLFDPGARLTFFQGDKPLDWFLAGDEAHNLPERSRGNLSFEINLKSLSAGWEVILDDLWRFNDLDATDRLRRNFLNVRCWIESQLCEAISSELIEADFPPGEIVPLIEAFTLEAGRFLAAAGRKFDTEAYRKLIKICSSLEGFANSISLDRHRFIHYIDGNSGSVGVKCLDASQEIAATLNRLKGFILFSGTINSFAQYRAEIGATSRPCVELNVPVKGLESNRLLVLHAAGVDTYRRLRQVTARKVARTISKFSALAPGSILTVFPSYEYLSQISILLESPDRTVLIQRPDMSPAEREDFKSRLTYSGKATIGMIVAGGQFSEAEDYPGEVCVGVVIVGPCLPPPDPWREALAGYWFEQGVDGFEAAYIIPSIRKIVQAAGRLIRTESDRGIVLLLDDRFIGNPIFDLLPVSWQIAISHRAESWVTQAEEFWNNSRISNNGG